MSKPDGRLRCGAWVQSPAADRTCVLAAGHYTGPKQGTASGMHPAADGESWHTDCPAVAGMAMPLHQEHDHEHPRMPYGSCLVWADTADGAHPSDVTPVLPDDQPDLTVKESGRTLGTSITGGYRADVKIGDTGLSVYGPARFVANIIRTFADAFEEEAER